MSSFFIRLHYLRLIKCRPISFSQPSGRNVLISLFATSTHMGSLTARRAVNPHVDFLFRERTSSITMIRSLFMSEENVATIPLILT
jgi:hypothetical protein